MAADISQSLPAKLMSTALFNPMEEMVIMGKGLPVVQDLVVQVLEVEVVVQFSLKQIQ